MNLDMRPPPRSERPLRRGPHQWIIAEGEDPATESPGFGFAPAFSLLLGRHPPLRASRSRVSPPIGDLDAATEFFHGLPVPTQKLANLNCIDPRTLQGYPKRRTTAVGVPDGERRGDEEAVAWYPTRGRRSGLIAPIPVRSPN